MQKKKIRLNKAIASSGLCSRRKAEDLIKAGKVKVNGKIVAQLSVYVFDGDKIEAEGKLLQECKHKYILFYKPCGFITTMKDEFGRKTIYDLLPMDLSYAKPVGRLDGDSEGLLLLSSDGDFISSIQNPKYDVKKVYHVSLKQNLSREEINLIKEKLLNGMNLDGKVCKIDGIKQINISATDKKHNIFEVVIHEGRNRQLRRLFQKLGYTVDSLKRIKIGGFELGKLKRGSFKEITRKEAYEKLQWKC